MTRPLSDTRIVNLGLNVPGPLAAARLAGFGATVTKVEPPTGDALAMGAPEWYQSLTEGQEIVQLDLKNETDRDRFAGMLDSTDLLLTTQLPSALERLALDWDTLHARFPRLCQVAIVGYPPPDLDAPGHDLTFMARHGLLRPPAMPLTLAADILGAERAVSAALGLLLSLEKNDEGGYIEVPIADAAAVLAQPLAHGLTTPGALLGGGVPGYGLYAAQDGYVAVAALEPRFFTRLIEALGLSDASRDELERVFEARPAAAWEAWAKEHDLPIVAVRHCGPTNPTEE